MDDRRRVTTKVGELVVRVTGSGPVAVLWHSLFVDERSWQRVEQALARERRLVLITGPGHGDSDDPGHRYSLDDCARAAVEILDALGIEGPVDWVGNAWGGHVGIVFAASWPDRCRSLVTLGTPVHAYRWTERVLFHALVGVYRVTGMVDWISSGIVNALLAARTRTDDPEAAALVLGSLRTMRRAHLANAMRSISLGRPDLAPRLTSIRCPVLFVTGSDHAEWTPVQAAASARVLSKGASVVVEDTAYLIPLEAPAATVDLVQGVWAAHAERDRASRSA